MFECDGITKITKPSPLNMLRGSSHLHEVSNLQTFKFARAEMTRLDKWIDLGVEIN